MRKYLFIIGFLTALISCNNEKNKGDSNSKADSLALQQKKIKKLTDDELTAKLLRHKNNALTSKDTVFYKGVVKRPKDSGFIALNLYGKAKQGKKLTEFKQTAIIKDENTITSRINGSVFRIDPLKPNTYKIYTHNPNNNSFVAYDIDFNETPPTIKRSLQTGNFYFDLLPKKNFVYRTGNATKFFNIRKDQRIVGDPLLDTLASGAKVYREGELLRLHENAVLDTYYFVSDSAILEKLIVKDTQRIQTQITLSGVKHGINKQTHIRSRFLSDVLFQQTEIRELLSKNSKHIIAYSTDSVIKNYTYNKDFRFTLKGIDSFQTQQTYPQYYPSLIDSTFFVYSKPFNINNEKMLWRYSVRYTRKTNTNPDPIEVSISKREMIHANDSVFVFEAPLAPIKKPVLIENIAQHEFNPSDFDINFDGYTDLDFPEGYDLNRNATYAAYVYVPELNTYLKDDTFTGPSMASHILLDKDNKAAIYTAKTGSDDYSVRIITMTPNGTVKHKETYWSSHQAGNITIHYQKTENNAVVEKTDDIAKGQNWSKTDFKNQFLSWVSKQMGK